MLPGMDGFELCHRLRAAASKAELPVLMLSAKPLSSDRETGFAVGANEYLTKPVEPSELLAGVERLLAAKGGAHAGRAKTIAFVGSNRGVGTSTVAANIAVAMVQMDKPVILADLCPDGGVSGILGLEHEHTLAGLLGTPTETINSEKLEAILTAHGSGVKVLCSSRDQDDYDRISPTDVEAALEELRIMAKYVLFDLPAEPSDITRAALGNCDFVTLVISSAFGSRAGDEAFTPGWLAATGIDAGKCGLLLVDKGQLLNTAGPAYANPQIPKVFNMEVLGVVPFDVNACNRGEHQPDVAVVTSPQCMMASSLAEVTHRLLGMVS